MSYRPCHFIGLHHLSHLEAAVVKALAQWTAAWSGQSAASADISTNCERIRALVPGSAEGEWTAFDFGDGLTAWARIDAGAATLLLKLLSGSQDTAPQHEEASAFAEELGLKLLADLFKRLDPGVVTVFPNQIRNAQLPGGVLAQWSGAVQVELIIGPMRLRCVLSSAWVSRMVPAMPRRETMRRPLEALNTAVRSAKMPVRVRIDATEGLSLGLFSELTEGSVVVLGCVPEAPWTIRGPGDGVLSAGHLARAGDNYAVQLTERRIYRG